MTGAPPTDAEVLLCLEDGLRRRGKHSPIAAIERRPYAYATSFPLEVVSVHLEDGRRLELILKDLTWECLLGDARRSKPPFLYDPRRCITTYERTISGTGMGADCYGSFVDDVERRYWLLIEKVPGIELWQVGDFSTWEATARWLARFHLTFAAHAGELRERNPHLLRYDRDLLSLWPARALDAVGVDTAARDRLARVVSGYDEVVDALVAVPPTFVHGELYASNVLVRDSGSDVDVWPIDWEMAGVGPPLLDLAALTTGWDEPEQAKLVQAYVNELGPSPWQWPADEFDVALDRCRLHYALQWLGWSADWTAPLEHARDWVSDALLAAERLGL